MRRSLASYLYRIYKEVDSSIIWAGIVANKEANLIGDIISF